MSLSNPDENNPEELPLKEESFPLPAESGDIPLQARGTYSIPDEGHPEEQEKEETGPLSKRIESKTWKTRSKAYEELTLTLKSNPNHTDFQEYISGLPKYLSDSNPGSQEKALDLFKVYLEHQPELLLPVSEALTKSLIEKGMASAKASIKSESQTLLLDFFSIHKDNFEGLNSGLLSMISNKNIKVQAAGLQALNSLMSSFGVKKVNFKTFVSAVEKHAAASNPQVRSEALNFYKESFRWVRELIKPAVEKLKKPQQDELQKAFEEIKDLPAPTRWLKSEEASAKSEPIVGTKRVIDIYEMADAKDVFGKYGEKWCNSVLAMEKWTEKKAALEEINKELDYPKLAEKSAGELVTLAKRLIIDSNVQVMLQSMKLVGLLAKGQRKYFDHYAKQFLPTLLQKFKDKKTQVIQETHTTLDNLLFSLTFEQCLEDLKEALEDKTPAVKTNTSALIERLADNSPPSELRIVSKPLVLILKKNSDDPTPEVRNTSLKLLSFLTQKAPDIFNPLLKDLPAAKLKKIEELIQKPSNLEEFKAEEAKPLKPENPSKPKPLKPEDKKSKTTEKVSKEPVKDPIAKSEKSLEDDTNNAISAEEAENIVTSFLPVEILTHLKDSSWKEKQSGLQKLSDWLSINKETVIIQNEAILRFVRSTVKDWKENNFNVVKAAIEIFTTISENYSISKRAAASVLNSSAVEKLADTKLIEVYSTCVFSLCSQVTPKFVVSLLIKNTSEGNKPKVVSEAMNLVFRIIQDYGPSEVNLKEAVDYSSAGMSQANPAIKKASQSMLVLIFSFLGEKLIPLLSNIKESTMKVLQEEFAKTAPSTAVSFKSYKGQVQGKPLDVKKLLDADMPRASIEKQAPGLVKKMNDSNWKVRKDALDEFEALIIASKMRIQINGLEALTKALAARIVDANKSIARQALILSGKFAEALGSECKIVTRQVLPNVILSLGDKQNLLRADAVFALNKWAEEAGCDVVFSFLPVPLMVENPEMRNEILSWMLERKEKIKEIEVRNFVQPTLACLQDKSAAIRGKSELLFSELVEIVKFESFQPYLKDIKPAIMNSLNPIFDKYRPKHSSPSVPESPNIKPSSKLSKSPSQVIKSSSLSKPSEGHLSSRSSKEIPDSHHLTRSSDLTMSKTLKPSSKQPPFELSITPSGNKARRLEQESKSRWLVDELRKDYIEKLKEQMRSCFSEEVFNLLFHVDFKKQVIGVGHLVELISSNLPEIIEILDILLKWVWIRMQEANNTQLIKSILEMTDLLLISLITRGYTLHEVEASLFLPIFCDKSGQNNAQFKQMIRGILHKTSKIFPPHRVFAFVLNGASSKNTKSKVECLEELSDLIVEYGIEVCSAKDVKCLAKYAGSSDNQVRNAAVHTVGEVFRCVGDRVWQMIGEVPDKVRTVLDQRFKALNSSRSQSRLTTGSKIPSSKGQSLMNSFENSRSSTPLVSKEDIEAKAENKPEISKLERLASRPPPRPAGEFKKASSPTPETQVLIEVSRLARSSTRTIIDIAEVTKVPFDINEASETLLYDPRAHHEIFIDEIKDGQSELDRLIETLRNGDMSSRVDALVAINDIILISLDKFKEELIRKANCLADALTRVIFITFEKPSKEIPLRFAKYFLTVVNKVCCTKLIVKEFNENSLFGLVEQVLTRLLIDDLEKLGVNGEGEALLKNLNATMLRILEHCKPTLIFVVLIRLMSKYKSQSSLSKMPSLIIRCLLKLHKILPSLIRHLEVSKILLAMHEYLLNSTISSDDVGLRTMKTILTELVKLVGTDIWVYYEEIKKHSLPDTQIEKWIQELLKVPSYSATSNLSPRTQSSPVGEIFLVLKIDYSKGIASLKDYLQKHPETDYSGYLAGLNTDLAARVRLDLDESQNSNFPETVQSGPNLHDFKKRLAIMKERFGIQNNQRPSEVQTFESLKNKAKDLLVRQNSRDSMK
jgi:cytoskeleton-associated protein 5